MQREAIFRYRPGSMAWRPLVDPSGSGLVAPSSPCWASRTRSARPRAGRRILKAVRRLPALSRRRVKDRPLLTREIDAEPQVMATGCLIAPDW